MSACAAQEPDSQENWHPRLADCFQVFGTGGERLLPEKLKVSFPTFRWASCGSGVCRVCVSWSRSIEKAPTSPATDSRRHTGVVHDSPLSGCPVQLRLDAVRGIRQCVLKSRTCGSLGWPLAIFDVDLKLQTTCPKAAHQTGHGKQKSGRIELLSTTRRFSPPSGAPPGGALDGPPAFWRPAIGALRVRAIAL